MVECGSCDWPPAGQAADQFPILVLGILLSHRNDLTTRSDGVTGRLAVMTLSGFKHDYTAMKRPRGRIERI